MFASDLDKYAAALLINFPLVGELFVPTCTSCNNLVSETAMPRFITFSPLSRRYVSAGNTLVA